MALRLIARDLYRLQREVDRLKAALNRPDAENSEKKERELAQKISERDQMRKILDGRLNR
jgi:hypothetical protein